MSFPGFAPPQGVQASSGTNPFTADVITSSASTALVLKTAGTTSLTFAANNSTATFVPVILAPDGTGAAPAFAFASEGGLGMWRPAAGTLRWTKAGSADMATLTSTYFQVNGGTLYLGSSLSLVSDGSALLEQKNSTTAQEFRVYGTTTGPKYTSLSHNGTIAILDSSPSTDGIRIGGTGGKVGFYATAPISLQTGVAVTAAGVHAALVNLGLITA